MKYNIKENDGITRTITCVSGAFFTLVSTKFMEGIAGKEFSPLTFGIGALIGCVGGYNLYDQDVSGVSAHDHDHQ